MTTRPTARAAAEAGTTTREQRIQDALDAYHHDLSLAVNELPADSDWVGRSDVQECRTALTACLAHLDELARLIAQRDGYAAAQSIRPDVALPVGGRGR
jgi:hypothetical protein